MTVEKTDKVQLYGAKATMLSTLYCRAVDSRDRKPVLGDRFAVEAVKGIDYGFWKLRLLGRASDRFFVVLRAKQLDEWATDFLARHPDATVLQLGCGLDSRAFRLHLPEGVRWFDVDYPDVIGIRRQLYPERDNYRMLAASLTESAWLDEVPADRPTLVIAEGVLPYLDEADVRQLLRRLTDRFGTGELLFDGIPRWMTRWSKLFRWAISDGREIERWNPRLTYVTNVAVMAKFEQIPRPGYRLFYRLMSRSQWINDIARLFRFQF